MNWQFKKYEQNQSSRGWNCKLNRVNDTKAKLNVKTETYERYEQNKSLSECTLNIDFTVQRRIPTTTDRVKRQLPDIEQVSDINDSLLTSKILSKTSAMEIIQDNHNPINTSMQKRIEQVLEKPPLLSTTSSTDQQTPFKLFNTDQERSFLEFKMARRLPITPLTHAHMKFRQEVSSNIEEQPWLFDKISVVHPDRNYRSQAQKGLTDILQSGKVRDEVKQYCVGTIAYNAMMKSICKEKPRKRLRAPLTRKGPWMSNR